MRILLQPGWPINSAGHGRCHLAQTASTVPAPLLAQDTGRYGVYAGASITQRAARSWWGRLAGLAGIGRNANITLAAFPLDSTLTAANLARLPGQGPVLQELMQLGLADARTAVILYLAVERQRLRQGGSGGGVQPWLALLPSAFSTTLFFSEPDMQWLRGTTLHKATR